MSSDLIIKNQVYRKMTAHSLKYLTEDVTGLLVGKIDQYQIVVHDAYPLFHSKITAPLLEVACDIVDGLASKEGFKIIGIYESLVKNFSGDSIVADYSDMAPRILETINEVHQKSPLLISVQEKKTEEMKENKDQKEKGGAEFKFKIYQGKKGVNEIKIDEITTPLKDTSRFKMALIEREIESKAYRVLADFQDHLENINEDFRNTFLNDAK